jgi:hypothetical protein
MLSEIYPGARIVTHGNELNGTTQAGSGLAKRLLLSCFSAGCPYEEIKHLLAALVLAILGTMRCR